MPDSSLTIAYTITSITNSADGLSTIVWSMSHSGTSLTESRPGDKFKTSDLTSNIITSTDDGSTKIGKVKANFENFAVPYFQAFAKRVRLAQEQTDANYLDELVGSVSGLSVGEAPSISGSVTITN
jgi:hypothetical protein